MRDNFRIIAHLNRDLQKKIPIRNNHRLEFKKKKKSNYNQTS